MISTPSSSNGATFGLQNRDSASERIAASRSTQQRVSQSLSETRSANSDAKADFGLQDRGTASERVMAVKTLQQAVVENHGFEAKQYIQNALTNNTKIINTPPLERGSLLDTRI